MILFQFPAPLLILLANSSWMSEDHGFAFPAPLILPTFQPNDPRQEFANSIHCYRNPVVNAARWRRKEQRHPLGHRAAADFIDAAGSGESSAAWRRPSCSSM